MNLSMAGELATAYTSGSQRARVVTESWGENNLYCPNCPSSNLRRLKNNTRASDFVCPQCGLWYQLKSQRSRIANCVNDGAYEAMVNAIETERAPSFYFMQYELTTWSIKNLILIPHFAFPASAILKRNPLALTARRAGWIGCKIALNRIPVEARISIVSESQVIPERKVRQQFRNVKPLQEISVELRGWTLDVLAVVQSLSNPVFSTRDIYALVPYFEKLYPGNRHVREKIRQQLQVLRDIGFLDHLDHGRWRLRHK